ncbi:hypothetical protein SEA_SOJO_35 [Streptomyces phage SoJo]|nr:hypothetical protein SEA_SOJO_35 [Streptomyces phage SoJo]
MIRPQLTNDGTAVRFPLAEHVDRLVDDLAIAYAADPDSVGRLLAGHAAAVLALDFAACSETETDYGRAMRAAEADGTREALLDELPPQVDPTYAPDDAITLAGRITRFAAAIRHRTAPEGTTRP